MLHDTAFSVELFVIIFGVFCWLFYSPTPSRQPVQPQQQTASSFDQPQPPVFSVLPDPWFLDLSPMSASSTTPTVTHEPVTCQPLLAPAFLIDAYEQTVKSLTFKQLQRLVLLLRDAHLSTLKANAKKAALLAEILIHLRNPATRTHTVRLVDRIHLT